MKPLLPVAPHLLLLLSAGCLGLKDQVGLPEDSDTDADDSPVETCPEGALPTLETSSGCVIGVSAGGSQEAFLGIPYAEDPVGPLRFRPPEAVAPWEEPLLATDFGPACVQTAGLAAELAEGGVEDEACLSLNLWRPTGEVGLPILFFVHGGMFLHGSGAAQVMVEDATLADGAVVVTHNARLGPFGYLAHPALSATDKEGVSGNAGLRDTLEALRWVRENAEALGGDPDKLLVVGQEAGGQAVCALLASRQLEDEATAVPWISGAVLHSAPCGSVGASLRESEGTTEMVSAELQGQSFAEALGCAGENDAAVVDCLAGVSAEQVRDALPAAPVPLYRGEGAAWGPVGEGVLLPADLPAALAAGDFSDVPLIIGINAEDGKTDAGLTRVPTGSELIYKIAFDNLLKEGGVSDLDQRNGLANLYSSTNYGSYESAFAAFYRDAVFACPTRDFLRDAGASHEVYAYLFRPEGPTGADTGAELRLLFGTDAKSFTAEDAAISALMQASWAWFAAGWVALPGVGDWPPFLPADGIGTTDEQWALLNAAPEFGALPWDAVCDLLESTGWGAEAESEADPGDTGDTGGDADAAD